MRPWFTGSVTRIVRLRRGMETEWVALDPILMRNEPGVTTDTGGMKVGDGQTPWRDLPWVVPPGDTVPPWVTEGFTVRSVSPSRR